MRVTAVLIAALVTALLIAGWLPVDRMPIDLRGVPLPMILFIGLAAIVLAIFATSGRSRRL